MTDNRTRRDTANQANVPEAEREGKDPLPWLIRNLREKNEALAEQSRVTDPSEQAAQ